jgi:hypothetical protein
MKDLDYNKVYQTLATKGMRYALTIFGWPVVCRVFNPEQLTEAVRYTSFTKGGMTFAGRTTFPTVRMIIEKFPQNEAETFHNMLKRQLDEAMSCLHKFHGPTYAMDALRIVVDDHAFLMTAFEKSDGDRSIIIDLEISARQ